jgi:uncharacterized protein YkwD
MNWIDLTIIIIVVLAVVAGVRRGFLRGVLDLVVIAISLFAAAYHYGRAAELVLRVIHIPNFAANVLGFVIVAALVQSAFTLVVMAPLSPLIRAARNVPVSRELDLVLGAIPGLVKGLALATTLLLAFTLTPFGATLDTAVYRSRFAEPLLAGATSLSYRAQESSNLDLTDFMLVTQPGSAERYDLPYAVTSGLKVDPKAEQTMFDLVNQERAQHGLAALDWDPRLQEVARAHSEEMWRLAYFAHDSPVHGSPGDRFTDAGIRFRAAGENLALAPTVEIAHRGLMRSEGHRANILSPEFTRIGIGAVTTPSGSTMYTQDFTG